VTAPEPAGTVPAAAVPAGTVPAGTVPAAPKPAAALAAGTVPAGTVPAAAVPAAAVPAGAVLGVDGGGTGCRAVLVRGGVVVQRRELGPLNVLLQADALDRLAALIADTGAVGAGLGLAGIRDDAHAAAIAAELHARTGAVVAVRDDTEAALAGAFRGGPGIVVIAGAGSGALGRDAAGRLARAGGHGFLLGDEGGGYWIGREAVRAALRGADRTGPPTALAEVTGEAFGDLVSAVQQVHRHPTDRTLLTRLVPAVVAAAAAGDATAARILAEAADHLAALVAAVGSTLPAAEPGDPPLPVAMVGGIFAAEPVRSRFVAATGATPPAEPAEFGAVRLLAQPTPAAT
jgi:glucosamine kinase